MRACVTKLKNGKDSPSFMTGIEPVAMVVAAGSTGGITGPDSKLRPFFVSVAERMLCSLREGSSRYKGRPIFSHGCLGTETRK